MLLLLTAAHAATLRVDPADSGAWSTIQGAIEAASEGDTLTVAAGSYTECLDLLGRDLTIEALGATLTPASACVADSAVVLTLGETLSLRGLTVSTPTGRAFEVDGGALGLDGVTVLGGSSTTLLGAGIEATDATLTLTGSRFEDLHAAAGGAIYAVDSDLSITGSTFASATASWYGGAILLESNGDDTVDLRDSSFEATEATSYGGSALYVWGSDSGDTHTTTVRVEGTTFTGASSFADAGAVTLTDVDVVAITDSSFDQNAAVVGGAVHVEGADQVDLSGCVFVANTSTSSVAGAVYLRDGVATLSRNVFLSNESTGSTVGALELYDTDATVLNNTFVGNSGHTSASAGAIFVRSSAVDFRNNLVAWTAVGPAVWIYDRTSTGTWAYNAFWSNTDGDAGGYASFSAGSDGNLGVDPSLVAWSDDDDPDNDDLRLAEGSPLVDAGDPATYDEDGSVADIGALAGTVAVDDDGDGYGRADDCDDHDAAISPSAAETCDGVDQDCDGAVDEDASDAIEWYADADGDGSGDGGVVAYACETPEGFVGTAGDCDDLDATLHPGADEVCDEVDQDCDGDVDEDAVDALTWYADGDGDGFGAEVILACTQPDGTVSDPGDCDDLDPDVSPAAIEACDGADDDCDGEVDEAGATGEAEFHPDDDGDGFGDAWTVEAHCDAPAGWLVDASDCDDSDASTHPGAEDTWYDGIDSDCADDDDFDQDRDGYDLDDDCDDTDTAIHPGAEDAWYDGIDSDCAGNNDDDQDGDGIPIDRDCDDTSITAYPGAPDTWYDGIDSNCAGDDDYDQDRDGYPLDEDCDDTDAALHPEATDIAGDGIDQDCDGADRETSEKSTEEGCGCASAGSPFVPALLALLAFRRRRTRG